MRGPELQEESDKLEEKILKPLNHYRDEERKGRRTTASNKGATIQVRAERKEEGKDRDGGLLPAVSRERKARGRWEEFHQSLRGFLAGTARKALHETSSKE